MSRIRVRTLIRRPTGVPRPSRSIQPKTPTRPNPGSLRTLSLIPRRGAGGRASARRLRPRRLLRRRTTRQAASEEEADVDDEGMLRMSFLDHLEELRVR
jgi:hypothetical protein